MPLCKQCNTVFSNRIVVGRTEKILSGRKSCLSCKPFRSHLTMNKHLHKDCKCKLCGKTYTYIRGNGYLHDVCAACASRQRARERKEKCVAYKGGACAYCGYKKCIEALVFHHKDPTQKDFGISSNHCRKWETIRKELDKCVMLCHNCHTEEHLKLKNIHL